MKAEEKSDRNQRPDVCRAVYALRAAGQYGQSTKERTDGVRRGRSTQLSRQDSIFRIVLPGLTTATHSPSVREVFPFFRGAAHVRRGLPFALFRNARRG